MRFAFPLIAVLLCGSALAGCATNHASTDLHSSKKTDAAALPTDVESGVQQAQLERLAGHYDQAIHILSQLMLVASDDPRVVGEYGKTLAEKGRAQEAVQFLTRATELQPTEWSYYSALGVAYDQEGDQASARTAYEHALKLRPDEPSVLNNYALSRMLANDPSMARQLIARVQTAGGAIDPKIARNIALVDQLAPASDTTAPVAPAQTASALVSAPVPVRSAALPPVAPSVQNASATPARQHPAQASQVVMEAVPVDPLAGPVKSATHGPRPLVSHTAAKTDEPEAKDPYAASEKNAAIGTASAAKPDTATKAKIAIAKTDAKTANARPATAKPAPAKADAKNVKAAETKPDTKADIKPAAKSAIPALRQTASAY